MITLTPDKLALVKTVFSIRIPVHQELGRSTPRQMVLYPCLSATVCRLV
jgi:hypothetical protein